MLFRCLAHQARLACVAENVIVPSWELAGLRYRRTVARGAECSGRQRVVKLVGRAVEESPAPRLRSTLMAAGGLGDYETCSSRGNDATSSSNHNLRRRISAGDEPGETNETTNLTSVPH